LLCLGLSSGALADGGRLMDGGLRPCPDSPNCVCSEGESGQVIPFPLPPGGWGALRQAIVALGGSIERDDGDYLHATFRSRLFGFVDDLECRLDGGSIQVRSAARKGWWDLGVNRRRVERLRAVLDGKAVVNPR